MTENKITSKKILNYAITIALFAGIAGMFLSLVFQFAEPQRIANARKMEIDSRRQVFPYAADFVEKSLASAQGSTINYVEIYDKDTVVVGYLLVLPAKGYSSDIMIMAGIDLDYNLTGMNIISQAETPGLGTRVEEPWFLAQFEGKGINALAVRQDGGEIAAITGATISSAAVANGVRLKVTEFKNLMEEMKNAAENS